MNYGIVTYISIEYYVILHKAQILFQYYKDSKTLTCFLEENRCRNELFQYTGVRVTLILLMCKY